MKEQIELYVKQGVVFRFPWGFRLLFLGNENPTHFQSIFITGESYIIVLCASEALVLPLFFIGCTITVFFGMKVKPHIV